MDFNNQSTDLCKGLASEQRLGGTNHKDRQAYRPKGGDCQKLEGNEQGVMGLVAPADELDLCKGFRAKARGHQS